jgi:hypothetical protein
MLKKILLVLLVAFIAIQFFRPVKNINTAEAATANDISKVFPVPDNVHSILKTSCYDCHSNNTVYPWYAAIQPAAWWLQDHVDEGKKEVNFNEFATYSPRRQFKKFEEIKEQVKEDEMPLSSYTLIHRNAILSKEQGATLTAWASALQDSMKAKYPADSLKRKK